MKLYILALILLVSFAFANDATDDVRTVVVTDGFSSVTPGPVWSGPLAILYDNGPWWNSAGTGVGGADESILEAWGSTYGWGCQFNYDNVIADDFVIPPGATWDITSITVGGYQTGSTTTPTLSGLRLVCYDDQPPTATVVYGDYTTNVFSSAAWSGIYRLNVAGSGTASNRPIMAVTATFGTPWTLGEGTYWLAFQLDGSLSSGPWTPPVVIMGTMVTGNCMQSLDLGVSWAPALNGGYEQGALFIVEGAVALQRSTWGEIKTVF